MRLKEDIQHVENLWKEEHLNLLKAWKKGMGGDLNLALGDERCSGFDDGNRLVEVEAN